MQFSFYIQYKLTLYMNNSYCEKEGNDAIYIFTRECEWSLRADWLITAGAYPGICNMKQLRIFLLSLDGMLVHHRSLPCNLLGFPNNSPVFPICAPGWREVLSVRVKCLEHNTVFLARAWTLTTHSGDEALTMRPLSASHTWEDTDNMALGSWR